jgi:hypothetical protein
MPVRQVVSLFVMHRRLSSGPPTFHVNEFGMDDPKVSKAS